MGKRAYYKGGIYLEQEDRKMSLQDHIQSLKQKHATLEAQLEEEENRLHPNDLTISELKRQKLRIKDELMRVEAT